MARVRRLRGLFMRRLRAELFPSRCIGCARRGGALCVECAPAPSERIVEYLEIGPYREIPLLALGVYDGRLRDAVIAFKSGRRDVGDALGDLLERRFGALSSVAGDLMVSVPTTARRRRERGFDGALLLAERLAGEVEVLDALRNRAGDSQRGRSRRERLAAAGRFAVRRGMTLRARNVVLVDDVVTTGASLREASAALEAAGARIVAAVAVARTPPPSGG